MTKRRSKRKLPVSGLLVIVLVLIAVFIFQPGLVPQPIVEFLAPLTKQLEPFTKLLPGAPQSPADSAQPPSVPAGNVTASAPGALPEMAQKPQPQQITFKGCPPEGDGGDPALNRLKNRIDEGAYVPVNFDAVLNLPWPQAVERADFAKWSAGDKATVHKYEGVPIAVEGYLFEAKLEGPESPNCHGADAEFRDFHVWLTKTAGEDRTRSIVVETTPRIRANHPTWTTSALNQIAKNKERVRISGWLMLDPEHPDQVEQTRGTIWEIHPIMLIQVQRGGTWVSQ